MKKIKTLILTTYALTLLAGCSDKTVEFKSIEIETCPKTTFYCGEEFTNTGIALRINLSDGSYFISEDVHTTKPDTTNTGSKTVKVFYTNEEYNIDTFVSYDINVIDWTADEKAIFNQTTLSSLSGIYYPKMDGMKVMVETDDNTGEILDYWIQKDNSSLKEIDLYTELLNNYKATKFMNNGSTTVEIEFKFYEQSYVPSDFTDLYDEHDLVCYKYCGSYKYFDQSTFSETELYAYDFEDTIVIGLNTDGDMIIRYIVDSLMFENLLSTECGSYLDFNGLYGGGLLGYIQQLLMGTVDEDGKQYLGYIDELGPLAKSYFVFPECEPNVCAIANYCSMYPWLHGEDNLALELEICSDDREAYDDFINHLDDIDDYVKTTRVDKVGREDLNVTIYTIEDKEYVGSITIEVTDVIDDGMTYTETQNGTKTTVTVDTYRVYYRWSAPKLKSPEEKELMKIYDKFFGSGNYDSSDYEISDTGSALGQIYFSNKAEDVSTKEQALQKFVTEYLEGYTVVKEAENKDIPINNSTMTVCAATYANGSYSIDIYTYYSNSKYIVEFEIKPALN